MNELTIEEKAKAYDKSLEAARCIYNNMKEGGNFSGMEDLEMIFPELEESDDERIRKKLLKMFNDMERDESILDDYGLDKLKTIAWLEKQETVEEIVERCKASWFNAGKIQGMMEGLSDEEKYQQGWHDAIENQGEQKPAWNEEDERIYQSIMDDTVQENQLDDRQTEWLSNIKYRYVPQPKQEWSEDDRIHLGNCIALIHRLSDSEANWLKSLKDRIQSKQSNKPQGKSALEAINEETVDNSNKIVNAKFKVGDWVVRKDEGVFFNDIKFAQITEIDGEKHWFDTGLICLKAEDMRLWTLEDAKDGDVLVSSYNQPFIYNGHYNETFVGAYCGINTADDLFVADKSYGCFSWAVNKDTKPATKEQRSLLFEKMREERYAWDSESKELIKIE